MSPKLSSPPRECLLVSQVLGQERASSGIRTADAAPLYPFVVGFVAKFEKEISRNPVEHPAISGTESGTP